MAIQIRGRREFHPAVSISSWLIFAIAVETGTPHQLGWLALAAAILLARREALDRFARLAWKAKWLWLAILGLYALSTPGIYLWNSPYSPTIDGLQAGGWRVMRLLLMLAGLARLLSELTPLQLAAGVYLLAAPLDWLHFDRRAFAARLALTLEQFDRMPARQNWLEALNSPAALAEHHQNMRLVVPEVGLRDAGLFFAACLLLAVSVI